MSELVARNTDRIVVASLLLRCMEQRGAQFAQTNVTIDQGDGLTGSSCIIPILAACLSVLFTCSLYQGTKLQSELERRRQAEGGSDTGESAQQGRPQLVEVAVGSGAEDDDDDDEQGGLGGLGTLANATLTRGLQTSRQVFCAP